MGGEKRERTVEELYDATEVVLKPRITPILRGLYCMQGPESDDRIAKNMVPPGLTKEFGKGSLNQEFHMGGESGTCNVCSAPCSSCMHLKRGIMGSKTEEFCDETFRVNASSQCSANEADAMSYIKSRAHDALLHSNLWSVNSKQDYSSENADSSAPLGSSDVLGSTEEGKMNKKISSCGLVAEDDVFVKSAHQDFSSKKGNSKDLEGHGDNISYISGSGNSARGAGNKEMNLDRKDLTFQSASFDHSSSGVSGKTKSSNKLCMSDVPASVDVDSGSSSLKAHSLLSHSQKGKSLSGSADEMDVEQIPSAQIKIEQPEASIQHVNSFNKELSSGQRSPGNQCGPDGSSSVVSMKIHEKSEKEDGPLDGNLNTGATQEERDEKLNKLVESSDLHKPSFQVASGNESDDSGVIEHDVKVCDICGDAGREDMLAICTRCPDGAEHIYCMRETLPNVPEGDWFCEECNLIEGVKNKNPDDEEGADEDGTSKHAFDAEEDRTNKDSSITKVSGKKHAENVHATSNMKRQSLDVGAGLPKAVSRNRIGEGSFKNLDKGKQKAIHQSSSGNDSGEDVSGMPHYVPRFQKPNGSLSKSKSFNTSSLKPKIKLVDEYIPISKKGDRENSHLEIKGGPARMLRKSMSWKPSNSSRLNAVESKVKMRSSKVLHSRDPKGLKPAKECNYFEKKNLSKLDHSRVSSVTTGSAVLTPKVDQKFTSPDETGSSVSINRDIKPMQSEGTSSTFRKSTSSLVHRSADTLVSPVGALSTYSSGEQKMNIVSPKEEPSSSSLIAGRPSYNDNSLSRSRESPNHVEKNQENSVCQSKPSVSSGVKGASFKSLSNDASSTKSSKDDIVKGNKLKAAIQAAVLKRPEICRKKRVLDTCDDVAMTPTESQGGTASRDRLIAAKKFKSEISAEGAHVRQDIGRSIADFDKKTSNTKQLGLNLNNGSYPIKLLKSESLMTSTENLTAKDFPGHSQAVTSFHLNLSGIPEHEYIWQGSFEIYKAGKHSVLHDGIQAHLSMSASPKVLEVANKFPRNVILEELPRLNTWPTQFQDRGATEDNIALFIFAKDIESYERNYKSLLGNMMSNDLALKANLGDVELLIFPSTHLPEKSQRWNTLFYLWGVLRGRRVNCFDSLNKFKIPSLSVVPVEENISSDNRCLPKNTDSDAVLAKSSSTQIFDENSVNFHRKESSFQQTHKGSQTNSDSNLPSPIDRKGNLLSGGEMAGINSLDLGSSGRMSDEELRSVFQVARKPTICRKVKSHDNFEEKDTSSSMIGKYEDGKNLAIDSTSDRHVTGEGDNCPELNQRKRSHLHLLGPAPSTSLSERNVMMGDDDANKKPRTDYVCSTSYSGRNSTHLPRNDVDLRPKNAYNLNDTPEDSATSERFFFPVETQEVDDFRTGTNRINWNTQSTREDDRLSLAPNLDLALGAETKPCGKAVLPFLFGFVGEKHDRIEAPDKGMDEKEDDSESLSLSLSFPFT